MPSFKSIYNHLNEFQRKAVDTIFGPIMLIAGPGTGKTTTLTARIAHILKQTDTDPSSILALTFTESGVQAMREKLVSLIGATGYYVNIHTFHSFALETITEYSDHFILGEDIQPLADLERIQLFHKIIDEEQLKILKPYNVPYFYLRDCISAIQDLKRECISPQDLKKYLQEAQAEFDRIPEEEKVNKKTKRILGKVIKQQRGIQKLQDLLAIYSSYELKLREINRYDFEDMITFLSSHLEKDSELLSTLQEKFLFIMVDEYQDTNSAQNRIIEILTQNVENPNIFVVGDDEQAIYRFQGASLKNMLDFTTMFDNATLITLKNNYRSESHITDAARDIIKKNSLSIEQHLEVDKTQISLKKSSDRIEYLQFSHQDFESLYVVDKIKQLQNQEIPLSEIAILTRTNSDLVQFQDYLKRNNIPVLLRDGENILHTGEVLRLINLFRLIINIENNPSDDILFFTVLNYEFLEIDPLDIIRIARFASEKRINMFDAILHDEFDSLNVNSSNTIKNFISQLYTWHKQGSNETFLRFFEIVLRESGYLGWILKDEHNLTPLFRINTLWEEVKHMNGSNHTMSLSNFLETIDLMESNGIIIKERVIESDYTAVRLLTGHGSKGLEFDYVFITKCINGKWGNNRQINKIVLPTDIINNTLSEKKERNEDERRLFYVALTRARKQVFITCAQKYLSNGNERKTPPSMFLEEIQPEHIARIDTKSIEKSLKSHLFEMVSNTQIDTFDKEAEEEFMRALVGKTSLNVTSLNTYLKCHYKFKLDKILKTPRAKSIALSFGTAIHGALEAFFKSFKKTKKQPSLKRLFDFYETSLKKEILTEAEFSNQLERGKEVLSRFYKSDSIVEPVFIEYSFGGKKVYLDDIPLSGKIDRIDWVDKDKKIVRVIDYKTGSTKSYGQVIGTTKDSNGDLLRQLLFYKLLAQADRSFKYNIESGEFIFLENNEVPKHVTVEYADDQLQALKKLIRDESKKMRALDFERTTNYHECVKCPYNNHCWPDGIPHNEKSYS